MPNHVTSRVVITGAQSEIDRFKALVFVKNEDADKGEHDPDVIFDFGKIIPTPECITKTQSSSVVSDAYWALYGERLPGTFGFGDPLDNRYYRDNNITSREELKAFIEKEWPDAIPAAEASRQAMNETGCPTWYEWNSRYWGTKWNAYSFKVEKEEDGRLEFVFDTAWSFPIPVFQKLTALFPQLEIDAACFDEGCNFSGVFTSDDGYEELEAADDMYERVYGRKPERDEDEEVA